MHGRTRNKTRSWSSQDVFGLLAWCDGFLQHAAEPQTQGKHLSFPTAEEAAYSPSLQACWQPPFRMYETMDTDLSSTIGQRWIPDMLPKGKRCAHLFLVLAHLRITLKQNHFFQKQPKGSRGVHRQLQWGVHRQLLRGRIRVDGKRDYWRLTGKKQNWKTMTLNRLVCAVEIPREHWNFVAHATRASNLRGC